MRRSPMRRGAKRSAYATRERDSAFMLWVKTLPCWARGLSQCGGVIEADHAGARGLGRKADDDTCIPLCMLHHRQRTDFTGPFKAWGRLRMRQWLADARADTARRRAGHTPTPTDNH